MSLQLLYICGLISLVSCHVNHRGRCPHVEFPMENFEPSQFLGEWYVRRSFDGDSSCLMFNYTRCGDRCLRVEETRQLQLISRAGVSNVYRTDGYLNINKYMPSLMRASFRTNPRLAQYIMLYTDYKNMALIFTCQNVGVGTLAFYHRRDVYLLTKNRTADIHPEHIGQVADALIKNQIADEFTEVSHKSCLTPEQATLDLNFSQLGKRMSQMAHTVGMGLGSIVNSVSNMILPPPTRKSSSTGKD